MPIVWYEDLAVGLPEVDAQHRELIKLINALDDAIKQRQGAKALAVLIDRLVDYAKYHFATEERLMAAHNYQHMGDHIREHEFFADKVMGILFHSDDEENRPQAVSDFLHKWLIEHIGTVDKLMGECLAV